MKKAEKAQRSIVVVAVLNMVVQKDLTSSFFSADINEVSQQKFQVEGRISAKALR